MTEISDDERKSVLDAIDRIERRMDISALQARALRHGVARLSRPAGESVTEARYLQIGGVTSMDFGNSKALRVRVSTGGDGWTWREPTEREYQTMLDALNQSSSAETKA